MAIRYLSECFLELLDVVLKRFAGLLNNCIELFKCNTHLDVGRIILQKKLVESIGEVGSWQNHLSAKASWL